MHLFEMESGIHLSKSKYYLVSQRLERRLQATNKQSYEEYLAWIRLPENESEKRKVVDLLTTNETYFFREADHFKLLAKLAVEYSSAGRILKVWSAACSSGEEPYSIAMVLAHYSGLNRWKIDASDLSETMLEIAKEGLYPLRASEKIPERFLKEYCLKGKGSYEGQFIVRASLRSKVYFFHRNLTSVSGMDEAYDVIFLRNVLIYFDAYKKKEILKNVIKCLAIGGKLIVGHAESVLGMMDGLEQIKPSVYVRVK